MLRPARPLLPPVAPKSPRGRGVNARVLREFLGSPTYKRWKAVLAAAGVELVWVRKGRSAGGRRHRRLTYEECRAVMETYYRQVGEFRMKRRKVT